jgi:hypothetical protein
MNERISVEKYTEKENLSFLKNESHVKIVVDKGFSVFRAVTVKIRYCPYGYDALICSRTLRNSGREMVPPFLG